jgi:hypothetical protein
MKLEDFNLQSLPASKTRKHVFYHYCSVPSYVELVYAASVAELVLAGYTKSLTPEKYIDYAYW